MVTSKKKCMVPNLKVYGKRKCMEHTLGQSLKSLNFMKYSQEKTSYKLIVGLYVDDLIVTSINVEGIKEFKKQMIKEF